MTWLKSLSRRAMAGRRAGNVSVCTGYVQLRVDNRLYRGHRLAWLITTGQWPSGVIDHINGVRHDNRWCNLRDVTNQVNSWNRVAPSASKSGLLGVTFDRAGRAIAQIMVSGRNINLGHFESPEQAHAAYLRAKEIYHAGCYFSEEGERARLAARARGATA